ncbi:hypothetical protein [uncultured Winogradskyella sp.]|uniref:hypothetical protein n=1 Tax=uncultured Winogradskyella sp. TaxID=395353 RepID=UPI00262D9AA4|nr:hypothetical protein [uncultured Winogradskyella sp.]
MQIQKPILLILLFVSTLSFGQNFETDKLWRTKGVYDSVGNFMERAKVQIFLYSSGTDQLQRLRTQDKINMETGETKIFIYKDTLNLKALNENTFKLNDDETITIHSKDSMTIQFNGYILPFVKLDVKSNQADKNKFNANFINVRLDETVDNKTEYQFTFLDNGLKKTKRVDADSEWESEYKLINFNGFLILQGITSAPKLITKIGKTKVNFLEIDYRFKTKKGMLTKG